MNQVLVLGDLHYQINNIKEIEEFEEKIFKYISTRKFNFLVILGDVLHEHEKLHTIPMNKAINFIDKLRKYCKIYVLVGNHDMINHQQFLSANHWMNGLKKWENVIIVDKVIEEIINNQKFIFAPFVAPGRFIEALDTLENNWKDATCIFAHQEFYGCKMGAIVSIEGDKWDENYPNVISGHIHSKQKIQKNIFYTGASIQQAFGESEKNIIAYIEFSDNKDYKLEEIDLDLSRKKIIYMDIEDIENFDINIEQKDKIKLSVKGSYEQFKVLKKSNKYKELINSDIKIAYKQDRGNIKISENIKKYKNNKFLDILYELVIKEKNEKLISDYNHIFYNQKLDEDILLI